MAKTKISEFSPTPANNTDIDNINIAEGCAPSGINDAIRELMAQLKDFQAGTAGDSFNGPIGSNTAVTGAFTNITASGTLGVTGVATLGNGAVLGTPTSVTLTNATGLPIATGVSGLGTGVATALAVNVGSAGAPVVNGGALGTPSSGTVTNLTGTASININGTVGATTATTGAFTTLAASGDVTLSGGTANGVAYLNGSKVLTTGSALTFDGTNLAVTGGKLLVGTSTALVGATVTIGDGSGSTGSVAYLNAGSAGAALIGRISGSNTWIVGDTASALASGTGLINYVYGNNPTLWYNNGSEQMRLTSTGLGIGTSSVPSYAGYKTLAINGTSGGEIDFLDGGTTRGQIYSASTGMTFTTLGAIPLYLGTNGTTRATLDSSGNLGLGVTPSAWVTLKGIEIGGLGNAISGFPADAGTYVTSNAYYGTGGWRYGISGKLATRYSSESGVHSWSVAPSGTAGDAISFTQAMTLDASGNLVLGNTATASSETFRVYRSSNSRILIDQASNGLVLGADASGPFFDTTGSNRLAFFLAGSERARIDSSGNLLIGIANAVSGSERLGIYSGGNQSGANIQCANASQTNAVLGLFANRNTTDNTFYAIDYYNVGAGAYKFRVADSGNVTNTNNSYGAISDAKLKENVTDATPKLNKLNQVRVVNFNMIGSKQKQLGVIAQELEQVFPGMVDESPDRDQEGNDLGTTTKSVKYSVFVPMLIKAIQELKAEFDAYKASHP